MVETCRVAIQGIKKSRVGEGWLGRTKKKEKKKKAGRILSSARRARIMSIWTSDAVIKVLSLYLSLYLSPFSSFQVGSLQRAKHAFQTRVQISRSVRGGLPPPCFASNPCSNIILFGKKRFLVSRVRSGIRTMNRFDGSLHHCISRVYYHVKIMVYFDWKYFDWIERISQFSFPFRFNLLDVDTLIIVNNNKWWTRHVKREACPLKDNLFF